MKFLVLARPGPMPPPVELVRSAQDWIDGRISDGRIECCYAFAGGGGFSVNQAESHEELMDELLDYPLSAFVEFEVRPLVGLDHAFKRFIETVERMTAAAT
jgi:hypothetical protein